MFRLRGTAFVESASAAVKKALTGASDGLMAWKGKTPAEVKAPTKDSGGQEPAGGRRQNRERGESAAQTRTGFRPPAELEAGVTKSC